MFIVLLILLTLSIFPAVSTRTGTVQYTKYAAGEGITQALNYVEQAGVTFDENTTNLTAYTIATEITDQNGFGPAYLLNGLTDNGWWYQVGIVYDWPNQYRNLPIPGFSFTDSVFSPSGELVDQQGAWNATNFFPSLGDVSNGDVIELSMTINGTSIYLAAHDLTTGMYQRAVHSSNGATKFVGLETQSNQRGYFSGVMTEWYRSNSSITDLAEGQIDYWLGTPITKATLWADEYNYQSLGPVYNNETGLIALSDSSYARLTLGPLSVRADNSHIITGSLKLYTQLQNLPQSFEYILPKIPGLPESQTFNVTATIVGNLWGGLPPYRYEIYADSTILSSGALNVSYPNVSTLFSLNSSLGVLKPGNYNFYFRLLDSSNDTYTSPGYILNVPDATNLAGYICTPIKVTVQHGLILVPELPGNLKNTSASLTLFHLTQNFIPPSFTGKAYYIGGYYLYSIYSGQIGTIILGNVTVENGTVYLGTIEYVPFGNITASYGNHIYSIPSCRFNVLVSVNSSAVYLGYGIWFDPSLAHFYLSSSSTPETSGVVEGFYGVMGLSALVAVIALGYLRIRKV
jgi:hypothetical protein